MSITSATTITDTSELTGRIFAIGDIHGHLERFQRLLSMIKLDEKKDALVLLGDYIDRGPESRGMVDYILMLKKRIRKIYCLMGNHELMFLNYLKGLDISQFINKGGAFTLAAYQKPNGDPDIPDEHLKFFASLLPYLETQRYVFVHGGLIHGIPLEEHTLEDIVWTRTLPDDPDVGYNGKKLVYGHYPMASPRLGKKRIGMDTGAGYGGPLACIELPREKIYLA